MFKLNLWMITTSVTSSRERKKTHLVDTSLFKSTSRQIEWYLSLQWIFPVVSEYIYVFKWLVTMIGPCGKF